MTHHSLSLFSEVKRDKVTVAADLFVYADDARVTGATEQECWEAQCKVANTLSWLGIQDAPRKRRGPRMDPGAWDGAVVRTDGEMPEVQVSDEKWQKTQRLVVKLWDMLAKRPEEGVSRQRLMEIREFLLYVTWMY